MKAPLRLLTALILYLFIPQQYTFAQRQYFFRTYQSQHGLLPGSSIRLWKDTRGFLWLLSENGLSRFDGYDFYNYYHESSDSTTLPSSKIVWARSDSAGNSFFLTSKGIAQFDYQEESFNLTLSLNSEYECRSMESTRKATYFCVASGLYQRNSKSGKIKRLPIPVDKNSFCRVADSMVFVFTSKGGFLFEETGKITAFRYPDGTEKAILEKSNYLFKVTINKNIYLSLPGFLLRWDHAGKCFTATNPGSSAFSALRSRASVTRIYENRLWMMNSQGVLEVHDLASGSYSTHQLNDFFPESQRNNVRFDCIEYGHENELWIGTTGGGLLLFPDAKIESASVIRLNSKNTQLPSDLCGNIMDVDPQVLWIFSPGTGLVKMEIIEPVFKTFVPNNAISVGFSPSHNIRTLLALNDSIVIVGSLGGLYSININNGVSASLKMASGQSILVNSSISNICGDGEGNILISEWWKNSLHRYRPASKKLEQIFTSENSNFGNIRCSYEGKTDVFFGSGTGHLYKLPKRQENIPVSFRECGIKRHPGARDLSIIFCLRSINDNELLIGSEKGLFVFDIKRDSVYRFQTSSENANLLSNSDIRAILVNPLQECWVGSNGNGLFNIDLKSGKVRNFTRNDGLPDQTIYNLLEDESKNIWMGTVSGICKMDPQRKSFVRYSLKDGIGFDEFNTNAAIKLPDGTMAFGGINGFITFNPAKLLNNSSGYNHPMLRSLAIHNKKVPVDSAYHLKHHENHITFQFAANGLLRNDEIRYAYMLQGLDENWIYCENRRFASYSNLQPGNYIFKVKCSGPNEAWNENVMQIPLEISWPWYNTWTAVYIYSGAALIITVVIYRIRKRRKKEILKIRDNIARDLHDEIGSNLSSISIFNEVAMDEAGRSDSPIILTALQKISEYARISQDAMSDIVWMIDSRNDRFENVFTKMRTLANETVGISNINLHLYFDPQMEKMRLDMLKRKNLYLIYKEALNNLLKHANCKNTWISLEANYNEAVLTVKDDGTGLDAQKDVSGHGLLNMKQRAGEMEGTIDITSASGTGTTLVLRFKL